MKIYLAGPITDCDDYKAKFDVAQKKLAKDGHVVINPAYLPQGLGNCDTYMHVCFPMIDLCDAVVMLDGWEDSRGACREYGYAVGTDKIVLDYQTLISDREDREAE